jgi:phosphoribosylformylglycinamidine cyclo-ligase
VPEGLRVKINKGTWPVLPIFGLLQQLGDIAEKDIYNTFNMGIGMVLAVDAGIAEDVVKYLNEKSEPAYIIGEIIKGEAGVEIC